MAQSDSKICQVQLGEPEKHCNPKLETPVRLFIAQGFALSGQISVSQDRQQQQRYDIGNLDHRVYCRASGILVRVANRVAGD